MPEDANISSRFLISAGFSLTIATICVILRFIARRLNKQRPFADDWLMLTALIFEWALAVAGLILVHNGLGRHIEDVESANLVTYLKVLYTGALLYGVTVVCIKVSLLTLYHRLFPIQSMTYACLVVGTVVICWGITTSVMGLLLCQPVRKAWQPETTGQCLNLAEFYYGLQIPNIITDVVLLALPLKPILNLRCSVRQRLLLGGIFGLGSLVVAFDVVRLIAMVELEGNGADFTWHQMPASIWTCVEPAVAISTACLVHLKPIVKWVQQYWTLESQSRPDLIMHEQDRPCTEVHTTAAASSVDVSMGHAEGKPLPPPKVYSPSRSSPQPSTPSPTKSLRLSKTPSPTKRLRSPNTPSPTKKLRSTTSPTKTISPGKASSLGSIDFMAHMTGNIGDLRADSIELQPARASSILEPGYSSYTPPPCDDPPEAEGPAFPDIVERLSVDEPDSMTPPQTPPSTPRGSVDSIVGIESALVSMSGDEERRDESSSPFEFDFPY